MNPADTDGDPQPIGANEPTKQPDPHQGGPVARSVEQQILPNEFELLEEIGRGGMGLVYRARDLAFDREVAVKLLAGKFSNESQQAYRFLEEARITGQLQHPGIPAVHQTGKLSDGRPYIVMKLIRGYTLSDLIWKKGQAPDGSGTKPSHVIPDNYLSIFESLCQAMGYAHAHGVIHRDLKPHNIMVGAFGEVQVMDWGLAKVLDHVSKSETSELRKADATIVYDGHGGQSTHGTELTTAGSVLGTPAYMAPEQAMGANADLDARSDVFGMGAILCCLLTGQPPFSGDHPESTRMLSAMGMLDDAFARLDACGAEPDLIALAKRCLAAKREDRPENGETVATEVARLRSAADKRTRQAEVERAKATLHAQEYQRRRVLLLVAGAITIALLLIGITGTTWGLIEANAKEKEAVISAEQEHQAKVAETEQRLVAEAREAETLAVLHFVEDNVFSTARPFGWEKGLERNVLVREVLDGALGIIQERFRHQPVVEARMCMTIGKSFEYLGENKTARELIQRAYELREKELGQTHRDTILAVLALANQEVLAERHQSAMERRQHAYRIARENFGMESHITQMAMSSLASSFDRFQRADEAFELRQQVLRLAREHRGLKNAFTMLCMNNLAVDYITRGRFNDAYDLLQEAIGLQKQHLGESHPNTLNTMCTLAECLEAMNRRNEALALYETTLKLRKEKIGPTHPDTLWSMIDLSNCLAHLNRLEDALKQLKEAMPLMERGFGVDHGDTLHCMTLIVARLADLRRTQEALPFIETFFKRAEKVGTDPRLLSTMFGLQVRHLWIVEDVDGSRATLDKWEKRKMMHVENHVELAKAWCLLGELLQKKQHGTGQGEADRAMDCLRQAIAGGWSGLQQLETERVFDILRGRDDFRAILGRQRKSK